MSHGVFDERLQQERRNERGFGFGLNVFAHFEARAEADFFDGQEALQEEQFLTERDAGFFAEAEGHAQKFGQQDAHFAGFCRIDAGQRADGIQAVEEEMGIYLRFQSFEFGIARQHGRFHDARLRFARSLQRKNNVIVGHG